MVENNPDWLKKSYPWKSNFIAVSGGQYHYLDEGEKSAPVLLAVHGNPTWSFYWRTLVSAFSNKFRVVIPDHIGCGFSDKPQDWPYRLSDHIDNLCTLVEQLDLKNIHLIVHDWGGAIGMGMAGRLTNRISKLIVTNTASFRSKEIPLSIASCRIPVFGSIAVRGFNAFAGVATWRASAVGLETDVKRALLFPYNSWKNRIATLRFVEDIPLKEGHPSYSTLCDVEKGLEKLIQFPMIIFWGNDDFCFSPSFRKEWEKRFPDALVHDWDDVGHYVMEDASQRVISTLEDWFSKDN